MSTPLPTLRSSAADDPRSWISLASPAPARAVSLLRHDPEFLHAIPAQHRTVAMRVLQLPVLTLSPGATPPPASSPPGALVVDGLIARSVILGDRPSCELFGPGDIIDGGRPDPSGEPPASWAVQQQAALAPLGDRFTLAAQRWPGLWEVVVRRLTDRADRLARHVAALQQSRVEERVLAVLWQLAERFGRVTPEGVVVPVALTHELLGRLVAARRPTVSLALACLADTGALTRRHDGHWLLAHRTASQAPPLEDHAVA